MVAQEPYLDLVSENTMVEALDEAEETLSLCDLPIYSDAADYKDFSQEYQSLSSSSSEQDCFEFFSEDWSTTSSFSSENIIFCGKLIPFKEPVSEEYTHIHKQESNKEQEHRNRGLFRWPSMAFRGSKSEKSVSNLQYVSSSKSLESPVPEKHRHTTEKWTKKYDIRVAVRTSSAKSKWYFFMFGLSRFPTEMELKDMRTRQMRRKSTSFRPNDGGEKVASVEGSRMKGWWGLIRALGCGGCHHANAVVKASFGGVPRA
ncbi:unnamed protein product [Ilex paraguariensis]|uniref:Uncharacterized protein n=1 Tax=Ilex paraguariensis TaxID=185542 RepID=A0ABC8QUR1_9AQUA